MDNTLLSNIKLGQNIKDLSRMEWEMGKENFIINKEAITKVIGKIIEWMVTESYFILTIKLRMKDNGDRTNFMEKELFIMTTLFIWPEISITQILIKFNSNGLNMMAAYRKILKKDMENCF